MARKRRGNIGGVILVGSVLLLGGGAAVWRLTAEAERVEPKPPPPVAPPVAAAAAEGPAAAVAASAERSKRAERHAKRDRIRAAWQRRDLAPNDGPEPTAEAGCTDECWGSLELQLRLAGAIEGCRELLPAEARGQARFRAHVIAEPEIGAVVESVEVLDDAIGVEAWRECIVESSLMAELAEPSGPVSDDFVFRYTAGPPGDNAADFLADHPEIVDRHPRLAAMLDRPADAPRSDDDATAFAEVVSSDEAAMAAFGEWVVEQGVDLSNVRVGE